MATNDANASGGGNPYAAPLTTLKNRPLELPGDLAEADQFRRGHLWRERGIHSLGTLYYLAATMSAFGLAVSVLMMAILGSQSTLLAGAGPDPLNRTLYATGGALFYVTLGAFFFLVGRGLQRLRRWARWTAGVLAGLGLLYCGAGFFAGVLALVQGYQPKGPDIRVVLVIVAPFGAMFSFILYLLFGSGSSVVFAPEYREVIAKTPYLFVQTHLIVKLLAAVLGLLLSFMLLVVLARTALR